MLRLNIINNRRLFPVSSRTPAGVEPPAGTVSRVA